MPAPGARMGAGLVYDALAASKPLDWFERELVNTVPRGYAGVGRVRSIANSVRPVALALSS